VFIAGYFGKSLIESEFRSAEIIAWTTLGFGLLLWLADKIGMTLRRIDHLSWGGVFFIGLMQVLALIPGTSRAGITMTAARFLGMERSEAERAGPLPIRRSGAGPRHRNCRIVGLCHGDDRDLGADAVAAARQFHAFCDVPDRAGLGAVVLGLWLTRGHLKGNRPRSGQASD
jgi:hypothetical protein